MDHLKFRLRALYNSGAWMLILLGLVMFSLRVPLPDESFINLPVAATVFQTAGLMFMLFGFQVSASMIVWPQVDLGLLISQALAGNRAAGHVVLGLMIFNGLCMIAFTIWLTGALGAGVTAK
jgi:hypothetical protein